MLYEKGGLLGEYERKMKFQCLRVDIRLEYGNQLRVAARIVDFVVLAQAEMMAYPYGGS